MKCYIEDTKGKANFTRKDKSMKNRIEIIRKERGIRQEEFAKVLGVSRQTISSLENGRYNPSILLAHKIAKYFDMGDISTLIAPRKLVMISGKQDIGFYIKGSYDAYATIEKVFKKAGVPDNCRLVVGEEGHRFYKDPSWDIFAELSGWREF